MTSIFLAGKIEETAIRIRDVITVAHRYCQCDTQQCVALRLLPMAVGHRRFNQISNVIDFIAMTYTNILCLPSPNFICLCKPCNARSDATHKLEAYFRLHAEQYIT